MNGHNKINNLEPCNGKCESCPNRNKKLAGSNLLFPAYFQNVAKATSSNDPVNCRNSKVDLSGLFGGESFAGKSALEPVLRSTACRKEKSSES